METNEFEIVTPLESGIDFITSDNLALNDVLLLWDTDAQQWKNLTISSLQSIGGGSSAQYLSHHILFDKTTVLNNSSGEISYNGLNNINVVIYEPNQSVNTDDDVTFSSVTVEDGVFSDYDLLLEGGQSVTIRSDVIRFLNKDGTKAFIDMDLNGDVYGNANSANQVNHVISIQSNDSYAGTTQGTVSFNGSEEVNYILYKPNQAVNTNSNVTFRMVTATEGITGNLNGNATSANKVNSKLHIIANPTFTIPQEGWNLEFDGSVAKSIELYTPDQQLNTDSLVKFKSVRADNINVGTNTEEPCAVFSGDIVVSYPYTLRGNVTGTVSEARRTTNSLVIGATNEIANVTSEDSFNGSETTNLNLFKPNQNVNTTSNVIFASVKAPNATVQTLNINSETDNNIGSIYIENDQAKISVAEVNAPTLNGNASSASKVNSNISISTVDSIDNSLIANNIFDGSEAATVTIKQYDNAIDNLSNTTSNLTQAVSDEEARALAREQELQTAINGLANNISGITSFAYIKVDSFEDLPETGSSGVIYLVPKVDAPNDVYTEYLYNESANPPAYESIGVTAAELGDYLLKEDYNTDKTALNTRLSTIESDLSTETEARTTDITTVTALANRIDQDRQSNFTELNGKISTEATTRENADAVLENKIIAETTARTTAVSNLESAINSQITGINNDITGLEEALGGLTYLESATLNTEEFTSKNVLSLISNDIDAAPLNVAIPKPYTPGNNISIDENNRISAVITAYTPGDHISIENNEISATYGNATTSTAGLMSPDDKFKLDGLAEGFGYYSIVQSNTDGHKFSLIKKAGESDPGETVSNIEIPDNDHRYDLSFDLSSRKLSLIEKVNESDANGVTIKQVTIPDSNTNYVLQIFDHELYMFTAAQYEEYSALELDVAKAEYLQHNEAELNHITIPDFNNSYTAGTGIEISDDGTISTTNAVRTLIYKVDELPTSNVDKEAIYVLKPQSGNDPATYKLFMDFSSEEDQEPIWKELGKQENEIEEATDDDISDLFASDGD